MRKQGKRLGLTSESIRQLSNLDGIAGGFDQTTFTGNTVLRCVDTTQCTVAVTQCHCAPTFGCPQATAVCQP